MPLQPIDGQIHVLPCHHDIARVLDTHLYQGVGVAFFLLSACCVPGVPLFGQGFLGCLRMIFDRHPRSLEYPSKLQAWLFPR